MLHARTSLTLALITAFAFPPAASAVRPHASAGSPTLEAAPGQPTLRRQRHATASQRPPLARLGPWTRFIADVGPRWRASWDRATRVPRHIWGQGIAAPGSVANPAAAAAHARAFLGRHLDLLAPGSGLEDFTLVSNRVDRGLRVVGFVQRHRGYRVEGGQVSFRFKNDRMFAVASQALPEVDIGAGAARLQPDLAAVVGLSWIAGEGARGAATTATGEPLILPLVGDDRVHRYALVIPVTVEAAEPIGRWRIYVDAATGERVARRQTLHFATGQVSYNAPLRYPLSDRADFPAVETGVEIDGTPLVTDLDGLVTWDGDAAGELVTKTAGKSVDVRNQAGEDDTAAFTIDPDGQVVWDARDDDLVDAQIASYVHARVVKEYVRGFAPDFDFLDELQVVNVNIEDQCNAFSDGTTINFFQASSQCANTAQLADVVYHEFGHSMHSHSIIEGVGSFDGAHSEGLSDYLAATITGDPAMGRGFFHSPAPLRHIDPIDKEHRWPIDIAGVHFTGLIFAGAMWDLRELLVDRLGEEEGVALADRLFYGTVQRAGDIPSTYLEALIEDDDNGNLDDGTPNICDINAAFGTHGLRQLEVAVSPLAGEQPDEAGHPVAVTVGGLFPQCPGDQVRSVVARWRAEGSDTDELAEIELVADGDGFAGAFPAVPDSTIVLFQVAITLTDLSEISFPNNPADAFYQFYVGETVELYCTGFESDPFAGGWTHGIDGGAAASDDWSWGAPAAPPAAGDPPAPFAGTSVIGNDLGEDGKYPAETVNFALSPIIDVGDYSDVHLQYWRWLTVEDAFYDQARILVNDEVAWTNLNSDMGASSSIHHEDREWRFHDVPISQVTPAQQIQIKFDLSSDGGLELGGWTIDELCVVANVNSICGDGVVTGAETCDEGELNSDTEADGCRTRCRLASCGDGVVDSGEQCDDGNNEGLDGCTPQCQLPDGGGGCGCQSATGGPATGALILLALFALARRRRERIG